MISAPKAWSIESIGLALMTSLLAHFALMKTSHAQSVSGYQQIVESLQNQTSLRRVAPLQLAPQAHFSFGIVSTLGQIQPLRDGPSYGYQKLGLDLGVGSDLFSKEWRGEVHFKNFGDPSQGNSKVTIQELDLRLLHSRPLASGVRLHFGGGVSARYTKWYDGDTSQATQSPSLFGNLGLVTTITQDLDWGIEGLVRRSLIGNALDPQSVDASVQIRSRF